MHINKFGQVTVTNDEAFNALYNGEIKDFGNLSLSNQIEIDAFNAAVKTNADNLSLIKQFTAVEDSLEFFDEANRCNWFIPEEYLHFPLEDWLYDQCTTALEKERVKTELLLFIQHNMFDALFYLKYLVDTMRKHNIVWGVGRGSSVASYVLYLLGVHKIDSIKYELDINEFLKEK